MAVAQNKNQGAFFERVFEVQAKRALMLCQKQALAFRYLKGGKILPVRAELDFSLINQAGQVCYVDCKTFAGDKFTFGQLNETQLKRAVRYNAWGIPSGFVVHFLGTGDVYYYMGQEVARLGPRTRFDARNGRKLGVLMRFDLNLIFAPPFVERSSWPHFHL